MVCFGVFFFLNLLVFLGFGVCFFFVLECLVF